MGNVLHLWLLILIWFSCFSDKYVCDLNTEKSLKTQITRARWQVYMFPQREALELIRRGPCPLDSWFHPFLWDTEGFVNGEVLKRMEGQTTIIAFLLQAGTTALSLVYLIVGRHDVPANLPSESHRQLGNEPNSSPSPSKHNEKEVLVGVLPLCF